MQALHDSIIYQCSFECDFKTTQRSKLKTHVKRCNYKAIDEIDIESHKDAAHKKDDLTTESWFLQQTLKKRDFRRKNPHDFDKREFEAMEQAAQLADRRYTKVLSDRDKQLRDDIDESSGLCSEPELNLNPYCKMYTDWL